MRTEDIGEPLFPSEVRVRFVDMRGLPSVEIDLLGCLPPYTVTLNSVDDFPTRVAIVERVVKVFLPSAPWSAEGWAPRGRSIAGAVVQIRRAGRICQYAGDFLELEEDVGGLVCVLRRK